jgi:CPA2 family monovalent cation:H+ antiporter-2
MPHDISLITTLAAGFGLALVFGFAVTKIRLPPLVGYLIAGIVIGPGTPGFVADLSLAQQLAEVGVILLMFGVGLHFSIHDLLAVKKIAVPGAVVQIAVATSLGAAVSAMWGWTIGAGLVFGLSLSVASTVVLLRALEDRGVLESVNGRIAVGWLIVEDLATVMVLVILPAIAASLGGSAAGPEQAAAASRGLPASLAITLGQVGVFVALMLLVGRRVLPWLLWQVSGSGSRELFTLAVIAVGLGIAYGAAVIFGVSFALGAFFAGMVMRESSLSHRAAEESLPLRDAFSVLFFVSVGMLFDPSVVIEEPLKVLTVVAIVMVGKSLAAFGIVLAFRYPLNTALTVSASLAQIGEFSFILAALGVSLGLLPVEGQSLILAGALISIALNPLVFHTIEPVQKWLREKSERARQLEERDDPLGQLPSEVQPDNMTDHVVLVGYGRVGRRIGEALQKNNVTFVVAEANRELVSRLRSRGILAVSGDASEARVLIQAHVARARILVIATPDTARARTMLDIARRLNPKIETVVRTHSDGEAELLKKEKVSRVFMGEHELARGMTRHVLEVAESKADPDSGDRAPAAQGTTAPGSLS